MYPPIFREGSRSAHNERSLERLQSFLQQPGSVVGFHPEGRRNKETDPYTLLPAQPGVGQLVMRVQPNIIPVFVNGLSNDLLGEVRRTWSKPAGRYETPIVVVYGPPVDCSPYFDQKPRLALYKRVADEIRRAISACGERERALREQILQRRLDRSPGWLTARFSDMLGIGRVAMPRVRKMCIPTGRGAEKQRGSLPIAGRDRALVVGVAERELLATHAALAEAIAHVTSLVSSLYP
jgi:hypothetical protein